MGSAGNGRASRAWKGASRGHYLARGKVPFLMRPTSAYRGAGCLADYSQCDRNNDRNAKWEVA